MILRNVPEDLKPAKGILNGLILSLAFWILLTFLVVPCNAQTWKKGSSITVGWDASADATGYKLYSKPETGGTPTMMLQVSGTQGTLTFTVEGRYLLGVSAVKTVGGEEAESTICWSNDSTCTFQEATFGLSYTVPPSAPKNFRSIN